MDTYRDFVRAAADGRKPSQIILNRTAPHAAIILEAIFQRAVATVQILTGRLNPDVYAANGIVAAVCAFLAFADTAYGAFWRPFRQASAKTSHTENYAASGR
jgi:hypothetical protein